MNITTFAGPSLDDASPAEAQRSIEDPSKPITAEQLAQILGGGGASVREVGTRAAMKISTVYACVRIISNAMAKMPLLVYERTERGRERATSHPLFTMLKLRPNPECSSFAFRSAWMANALLTGGGFAEIVRDGVGVPRQLVPIESERVGIDRINGELVYRVSNGIEQVTLLKRDILHLPGLTFNGVTGLSVITHARMTLAAALGASEFQAQMMENGLRPGGVLQHPKMLTEPAAERLRSSFRNIYSGPQNAGKPIILEEGMTWSPATMSLEDAQFVESSGVRDHDICRWFGVQPHKVALLERSTNNNIESQSLDFLGDTLSPWVELAEQEMNWKLLSEAERDRFYIAFLTQSVVQMDTNTRGQHYERMTRIGAMNPDEVRDREDMNRIPDERGTIYSMPSSQMPLPTPEQRDKIVEAWANKGGTGKRDPGAPEPKTDDKVAGAN